MSLRSLVMTCGVAIGFTGFLVAAPHPLHDDGGSVNWRPNWNDAVKLAQQTGRPIMIESGREN